MLDILEREEHDTLAQPSFFDLFGIQESEMLRHCAEEADKSSAPEEVTTTKKQHDDAVAAAENDVNDLLNLNNERMAKIFDNVARALGV